MKTKKIDPEVFIKAATLIVEDQDLIDNCIENYPSLYHKIYCCHAIVRILYGKKAMLYSDDDNCSDNYPDDSYLKFFSDLYEKDSRKEEKYDDCGFFGSPNPVNNQYRIFSLLFAAEMAKDICK